MDLEIHPVPVQGSLLQRDEDSFGNSGNRGRGRGLWRPGQTTLVEHDRENNFSFLLYKQANTLQLD